MSHPDPLIMSADIARMASERPELGEELTRALYQHLVLIEGRQPTIDELRDYVERVSSLDESALRQRLGLVSPRRRGRSRISPRITRSFFAVFARLSRAPDRRSIWSCHP